MSTHKYFDTICVAVILFAICLTILLMNGEKLGIRKIVDEDAEGNETVVLFTANDENADWDRTGACVVTLEETTGRIKGDGAYFLGNDLYIVKDGKYSLSGSLTGSVVVDAGKKSKVFVALDGVTVDGGDDAAFKVLSADKVFLTLSADTVNVFTSGEKYSEAAETEGVKGTVYAKDDLTINGAGALQINASYKHGIDANDDLVITGGTITVTSAADAIHVNDHFRFEGANLTIAAKDDGIHADEDIYIAGGTILIEECYEGLEAYNIELADGEVVIYSSDDGINACAPGETTAIGNFRGNRGGQKTDDFGKDFGGQSPDSFEGQGPFGRGDGRPFGEGDSRPFDGEGNRPFDREDNRPFGEQNPEQGEQPFDRDPSPQDMFGAEETENTADSLPCVTISGGSLTIYNANGMDADGIDSNGDIRITGGTILISMSGSSSNCALDYGSESGGKLIIDGGTVVAAGGSGMLEGISNESKQASATLIKNNNLKNSSFTVKNESGEVLIEATVPYAYSAITFSCPAMKVGDKLTVRSGDEETQMELTQQTTQSGQGTGFGRGDGFKTHFR